MSSEMTRRFVAVGALLLAFLSFPASGSKLLLTDANSLAILLALPLFVMVAIAAALKLAPSAVALGACLLQFVALSRIEVAAFSTELLAKGSLSLKLFLALLTAFSLFSLVALLWNLLRDSNSV